MALVASYFALREGREGELLAAPYVSSKLADEGFSRCKSSMPLPLDAYDHTIR